MIKPIFFPFTHLQTTDIQAISALFKSIFFFPASSPDEFDESISHIEDKDFIIPVYAENKDFEPVLQKVNEYRNWGELNKENKGNLKAFFKDKPYFTNDTYVPHLRANIERPSKESDKLPSKKDDLFNNITGKVKISREWAERHPEEFAMMLERELSQDGLLIKRLAALNPIDLVGML